MSVLTARLIASTDTSSLHAFRNCCHATCSHSCERIVFVVNLTKTLPGIFFYGITLISLPLEAVNAGLVAVVEAEGPCFPLCLTPCCNPLPYLSPSLSIFCPPCPPASRSLPPLSCEEVLRVWWTRPECRHLPVVHLISGQAWQRWVAAGFFLAALCLQSGLSLSITLSIDTKDYNLNLWWCI